MYPVPDSRTGDQVMAAIELEIGAVFDPDAFVTFLAAQPDLGTKWSPRFVRLVERLPVTATDKINKQPLRAERWSTPDEIWHRPDRDGPFLRFGPEDLELLGQEFSDAGRSTLWETLR